MNSWRRSYLMMVGLFIVDDIFSCFEILDAENRLV
jgi:hypothetical protein